MASLPSAASATALALKDAPHTRAHHRMIVGDQDAVHAKVTNWTQWDKPAKAVASDLDHQINGSPAATGLMLAHSRI
jgi:hypothetical protein